MAFTTPDGAETVVDYHPLGGVEALTGPAGAVRTERDARGHVRRVTTPAGRSWSFEWRGEAVTRADGPMGPVRYRVGRDGSRTGWRDASGRSRAFVRDDQGRLTAVRAGDGAAHRLRYDAHGRLRTLGTRTGERLGFRYDRHGRLVEQRSGRRGEWVAIGYAQTDEGLRIETPFGRFAQPDGPRPDRLETPAGPFELRYDRRGRRETTRFPNGVVAHVERDRHGRTTRRCFEGPATNDDHAVLTLETHYDDAQRPARWSRDGAATLLGYDDAGRLSRVDGPGLTRRFLYDADGNRLSAAREGRTVDSRYDDRGRLVRRGDERLDYDGAGRLLRRVREGEVVANYGYDAFGRLAEVRRGQHVVAYGYDPLDRIATRTVDGRTERYVYEGSRLLAAVGPDGAARVFVYGPDGDEPLAYRDGDRWTFLHADARGTVLAYSDAAGRRVASASFSPFGELLTATDPDRPLFYAGRLVDREAGLIPMRTRFYAPELGRFLTPDPRAWPAGSTPTSTSRTDPWTPSTRWGCGRSGSATPTRRSRGG